LCSRNISADKLRASASVLRLESPFFFLPPAPRVETTSATLEVSLSIWSKRGERIVAAPQTMYSQPDEVRLWPSQKAVA
jgi:hypothetical protein